MPKERNKDEEERLRHGVCMDCKTKFWWTGAISTVPPCGHCGRQHTKIDFKSAMASNASGKNSPSLLDVAFGRVLGLMGGAPAH